MVGLVAYGFRREIRCDILVCSQRLQKRRGLVWKRTPLLGDLQNDYLFKIEFEDSSSVYTYTMVSNCQQRSKVTRWKIWSLTRFKDHCSLTSWENLPISMWVLTPQLLQELTKASSVYMVAWKATHLQLGKTKANCAGLIISLRFHDSINRKLVIDSKQVFVSRLKLTSSERKTAVRLTGDWGRKIASYS